MADLPEEVLYTGVSVDITFGAQRPSFGDLFLICGEPHPRFPTSGRFSFEEFADLQFQQVDDYFGVPSLADDGDDVAVWLYPLVGGQAVHHHPGPFEGVRLEFNVLRNPARHAGHYLRCVERFSALGESTYYRSRKIVLGTPANLAPVREDIEAIAAHWLTDGVVVGSNKALEIDF